MGTLPARLIEHPYDESLESIERDVLASLRPLYTSQRETTLEAVQAAVDNPSLTDWPAIARELHALAGTAAHFGEDALGELARNAEALIRRNSENDRLEAALLLVKDEIESTV